jgi:hypothetical protein
MTALTRAGVTPIVPLSPMPLTPSGFVGDGVQTRYDSIGGSEAANGTA